MAKAPPKRPAPVVGGISLDSMPTIVTAKPSKRSGNPEVVMEGVADLTAIDRVRDDLNDAYNVVDEQIRAAAIKMLLDDGCAMKQRPSNFKGCEIEVVEENGGGRVGLNHSVSVELKNSGAGLSDEAQAMAAEYNIPVDPKITTHETYIINSVFAGNMKVMQAVVDALNEHMPKIKAAIADAAKHDDKIAAAVTAPVMMKQIGSRSVVCNERTLPAIFALPRDKAEMLLPLFSTLSVGKCKYEMPPGREDDLTPALMRTAKLLNRRDFREVMQATKVKKAEEKKKKAA